MGLEVHYCHGCGVKISPKDVERQNVIEVKGVYFCKACFPRLPKKLQAKIRKYLAKKKSFSESSVASMSEAAKRALPKTKKKNKQEPKSQKRERRKTETKRRLNSVSHSVIRKAPAIRRERNLATEPSSNSSSLWIWLSLLGGLAVFLATFFLISLAAKKGEEKKGQNQNSSVKREKNSQKPEWKQLFEQFQALKKKNPHSYEEQEELILKIFRYSIPQQLRYDLEDELEEIRWRKKQQKKPAPPSAGASAAFSESQNEAKYYSSTSSSRFHRANCQWAKKIRPHRRQVYTSRSAALEAGKRPCTVCKP